MDGYHFTQVTGRPASQPLPESHTGEHLPQMSTYSGSSQSRNTSVPQPINYGGRASGYNGVSQSRGTSVPQIEYGGSTSRYTGATQSRRTSTPQTESRGSVSGDNGSTQSRGTSIPDSPFRGYEVSFRLTPSDYSDYGVDPPQSSIDRWNQEKLNAREKQKCKRWGK